MTCITETCHLGGPDILVLAVAHLNHRHLMYSTMHDYYCEAETVGS